MSQRLNFFGPDGLYPGGVRRVGPEVDWKAIRDASYEREHASQSAKQSASNGSIPHTVHTDTQSATATRAAHEEKDPKRSNHYTNSITNDSGSAGRGPDSAPNTPVPTVSEKLTKLLSAPVLDLPAVRKLAWGGLPTSFRAPVWKILLGYVPTNSTRRKDTLQRRRREYWEAVHQHYGSSGEGETFQDALKPWRGSNTYTRLGQQEDVTMRQITVDLPRTCPGQALFHIPEVRLSLERILYVWATRHPASGYVQGMNDLVTPFVFVFLSERAKEGTGNEILGMKDLSVISDSEESLANAEADAYWCLTALLNDIQDYYTFSQPGIQRRVHYLRELVARVDSHLCSHLEDEGLDFLQFAFRWMNCLLMRELPFPLIARVWDTYLAESDGFAVFHVYVCAALLVSFSEELQEMDFQDMVMFLQNLPTESWTSKEVDVILSQAYMWRTIFGAAPSHLQ